MKTLPAHFAPAALFALALAASNLNAQEPATPATGAATSVTPAAPAGKAKPLPEADKKFFKDASDAILFEQTLAQMGAKDGHGEETKRVSESVNNDLKKMWEKFATLSVDKSATIAQEVSKSDASKAARIAKQKDEKFDKELLDDLGKESKKTTRIFESKSLQDPELKQFAAEWVPTLKGHETAITNAEKAAGKKNK